MKRLRCGPECGSGGRGGVFGQADAEGSDLLHALEEEIDAVRIFLGQTSQMGQDMVFLALSLLAHSMGR